MYSSNAFSRSKTVSHMQSNQCQEIADLRLPDMTMLVPKFLLVRIYFRSIGTIWCLMGPPELLLSHCSVIIMQTFYWEICHSLEKVKDYNVCILFLECMSVCNVTARYICTCIHLYEKSIVDKVSFHTYYIVMPFSKDTSRIVSRDRLPQLTVIKHFIKSSAYNRPISISSDISYRVLINYCQLYG